MYFFLNLAVYDLMLQLMHPSLKLIKYHIWAWVFGHLLTIFNLRNFIYAVSLFVWISGRFPDFPEVWAQFGLSLGSVFLRENPPI